MSMSIPFSSLQDSQQRSRDGDRDGEGEGEGEGEGSRGAGADAGDAGDAVDAGARLFSPHNYALRAEQPSPVLEGAAFTSTSFTSSRNPLRRIFKS
jgi:hypothetical protein